MKAISLSFSLLLVLVLAFVPAAQAQVNEATITADGVGLSRDEAIHSALSSAASQAFGVQLRSDMFVQSTSVDAVVDNEEHSMVLSALNKNVRQVLNSPVNAPILGYTIDDVSQSPDNGWEATVTLRYAVFERMGADSNRRSVVVVSNEKRYRKLLVQNVGETLVATRRFDVLNRENDDLFQDEKDFILGGDAAVAELARLSQAGGADYLVVAELQGLGISNNMRETIQMTGEVLVRSAVSGTLRLQVIEFASRKLKWSGSKKFGATYEGVSSIGASTLARLISNAADSLVDQMVAAIYPIRVVKVMGDTAIINRGEGSTRTGDVYALFLMGEEVIDPQSGESLGSMELEVGLGEVTEVKPKFAIIRVATGKLEADGEYLLRKTDKKLPRPAAKPAAAKSRPKAPAKPKEPSRKDIFLN